ncbi:MAG: lytic transglycosylase domain-containing protein, partial [Clostridia bacterium]|nr:lytic transglycosylase domain-containing protein [Clostridia bacterium]
YEEDILAAAEEFEMDPILIASVINAESRFDVMAISSKGAVGLMQIMPSTAEWVVKKLAQSSAETQSVATDESNLQDMLYNPETKTGELLDPTTNIRIGTYYLKYLIKKFDNLETALCAYNAGEGTVKSWLTNKIYSQNGEDLHNIPYKETEKYLNKVSINLEIYKRKIKL